MRTGALRILSYLGGVIEPYTKGKHLTIDSVIPQHCIQLSESSGLGYFHPSQMA